MTQHPERVLIHYTRPPDRVEHFDQRVALWRDDVVVTVAEEMELASAMRIGGKVVLEDGATVVWFTFPGAWHDIGRFHRADGTFTGLYANIITPVEIKEAEWHTTDLFLDLWWPEGGEPVILDKDELDGAVSAGLVSPETADRAREEAERILRAAREGAWPPPVVSEWAE